MVSRERKNTNKYLSSKPTLKDFSLDKEEREL
jgi:hypothetical protein